MTIDAETEVVFLSGYPCPTCRIDLELPAGRPDSWSRCPNCGRPSPPPNLTRAPTAAQIWGRPAAEAIAGFQMSTGRATLSRLVLVVAPIFLVVALAIDGFVRLWTIDETARMIADSVAFAAFGLLLLLGIRAMLRG